MKNITLSVEDKVLEAARRYATERDVTVNGLVREFLGNIAGRQTRARKARARLRQMSEESPARIGARRFTRDDLHAR
jgi:hypothetical protein